jgi:hypothetical protein
VHLATICSQTLGAGPPPSGGDTGRRTLTQISALRWSAPATPFLPAFRWAPFSPPLRPVE